MGRNHDRLQIFLNWRNGRIAQGRRRFPSLFIQSSCLALQTNNGGLNAKTGDNPEISDGCKIIDGFPFAPMASGH